jgi:membrane fusion protein, multidrug efflux system
MAQPTSISQSDTDLKPAGPAKKHRLWIWAVILALFALLFVWVYKQHGVSASTPGGGHSGGGHGRFAMTGPVPITLATAKSGNIGVYMDAIGTVTPVQTATITAQVTGVITAVHYREGQVVHKGDLLLDIDPRPYQAQLVQAQGALDRDKNLLAEAEMDLKRYQDAWAKNAIPRQTLEDQEKQVLQDKGTVQNDLGTVQYDQVQVGYCHISAPIDGRVGLRLVDPGNLVTANSTTPLVVVTQLRPITVIFTLAEDNLSQVLAQMHGGKQLEVDALDRTQQKILAKGRLLTIDNLIDTVTGTVKLRAQFDNADGNLFPNEFVNTRLLVKTLNNQVLVPSSAIQHNGAQDFVYLIQGLDPSNPHQAGKAIMKTIKSGVSDQGNTAVSGLNAGDVVANSSFQKLVDGSQVSKSNVTIPATSSDTTEDAP